MVNNKKAIVAVAIAAMGALGVSAVVFGHDEGSHTVQPAIGGKWDFGASGGLTWSNYIVDKPHSASVHGHTYMDTGCVAPNTYARARAEAKWIGILQNEQDIALCDAPNAESINKPSR